ncbi:MAG TPA: zinc dependent phospholipase C family protein [Terriglobia bacterium]|nr:zinc dependent phospholipase C family protein [Terriglobia bacterium]
MPVNRARGSRRSLVTFTRALGCLLGLVCLSRPLHGYAVLTHEAIIDSQWEEQIVPLLRARFPEATEFQIEEAHAYAYGGSVIQDMGYYPFGSRFFSHLTHYVRTGDFVEALFEESRDIDDYAFALGALSHYAADIEGHSIAVNRSVPLLYPRLHREYGNWITWENSPWAHSLTEFGFDTLEVVAHHNAPQAFRDWIGFKVPKPLVERAFEDTYGLKLTHQILSVDLSVAVYKKTANQFIPEMTEVAWALRRRQMQGLASSERHQRLYHLSRACYVDWLKTYAKPGAGDKLNAFLFRLLPKFGPLSVFDFHAPSVQTEQLFADGLKATVAAYDVRLQAVRRGDYDPPDIDLDTGRPTQPGEYRTCDRTYAVLLHKLRRHHFAGISPALRDNILDFYAHSAKEQVDEHRAQGRRVSRDLVALKALPAEPAAKPAEP